MDSSAIPQMELSDFENTVIKSVQLPLITEDLQKHTFRIYNRAEYPTVSYVSPSRRKFYKILHIVSGNAVLTIGMNEYVITKPVIAFIHPDAIISWQSEAKNQQGHFCLFHFEYWKDFPYIQDAVRLFPFFKADKAVIELATDQSSAINRYFELIAAENASENEYKNEAIGLQVQMILLEAKRAGKHMLYQQANDAYRYLHDFLGLLETSFLIKGTEDKIEIKTATEFAERLHIHPNYLNTLIKKHTGKTLKTHIQDRLLYEAKSLLKHTNWDIQQISYSLSFAEQASFTSFFHKKTGCSPSRFRDTPVSLK